MRGIAPFLISALFVVFSILVVIGVPTMHQNDCNDLSSTYGDTTTPIASLDDNWQLQGSFFIGSGHIRQEPTYTFYVGDSASGYQMRTIEATGVKIFTDENEHPYYLTKSRWVDRGLTCMPVFIQELHVPNNTIVKQYNLDGDL